MRRKEKSQGTEIRWSALRGEMKKRRTKVMLAGSVEWTDQVDIKRKQWRDKTLKEIVLVAGVLKRDEQQTDKSVKCDAEPGRTDSTAVVKNTTSRVNWPTTPCVCVWLVNIQNRFECEFIIKHLCARRLKCPNSRTFFFCPHFKRIRTEKLLTSASPQSGDDKMSEEKRLERIVEKERKRVNILSWIKKQSQLNDLNLF